MVYCNLDNSNQSYEIRINKVSSSADVVRYGYSYCTDKSYSRQISCSKARSNEGVYYIRNYAYDTYLTYNSNTGETFLQAFSGDIAQRWVVDKLQNKYILQPAGDFSNALACGDQIQSDIYKAISNTSGLHFNILTQTDVNTMEDGAVAFINVNNTANYILSCRNASQGVLVSCSMNDPISIYRSWVLEKVNYQFGDVDKDRIITIKDATAIQKHIAGLGY